MKKDILFTIYNSQQTVFSFNEISLLTGESNIPSLSKKLNYYVHSGKITNPRRGIYAKPSYNTEELACKIFKPSYISLEYVLQKSGVLFQYHSEITSVSYLSRSIRINTTEYRFRKVKNPVLVNTAGIIRQDNGVNIATAERAFLDLLYLEKECHFDNIASLDKQKIYQLLKLYDSNSLTHTVNKTMYYGEYKQA